MRSIKKLFIHILFTVLLSSSLFAQQTYNSAIEQTRRFAIDPTLREKEENKIETSFENEAPSSPGDDDLGVQAILHRKEKVPFLGISAGVSTYYTSNAYLTEDYPTHDRFIMGEYSIRYFPQITQTLYTNFSYRQQHFHYEHEPVLDFWGQTLSARLTQVFPRLYNIALYLDYTYTRLLRENDLTGEGEGTEFYRNHAVTLGVQKAFQLSKAHFIYIGSSAQYGSTDWNEKNVRSPQRNEYAVFGGYQASLTRSLDAQVYARLALQDYTEQGDRLDLNHLVSSALVYHITDWCDVSASASWTQNHSNRPDIGNYELYNFGSNLAFNLKF